MVVALDAVLDVGRVGGRRNTEVGGDVEMRMRLVVELWWDFVRDGEGGEDGAVEGLQRDSVL